MAKGLISNAALCDIANAIRVKTGSTDRIAPANMAESILSINGSLDGTIAPSDATGVGLISESLLKDIANAIRNKLEVETLYRPNDMAEAILSIRGSELPDFSLWNQQGLTSQYRNEYIIGEFQKEGSTWHGQRAANTTTSWSIPIPAGYKKLYIDIASSGVYGVYNLSTMYFRTAYGVTGIYGRNFTGDGLGNISFVRYDKTYDQIAAQSRILQYTRSGSGSEKAYVTKRQVVVVDISDIGQDIYIGWHRCDNETTIYSIIAKSS